MSLQLILGSTGAGKTHYIYETLISNSEQNCKDNIYKTYILLVPEQFTLQTQQDIIRAHPKHGIMNIEVLSFQRLAYRIFDDLQVAGKTLLDDTGKSMAIRKVVEDNKNALSIIHKNISKKGYVSELKGLITELYQYQIDDTVFRKIEKEIDDELLSLKLKDIELLFNGFKGFLEDKYITGETTIDLLVNGIKNSHYFQNVEIYIDGFYGFTPIQYNIIGELLKKAMNVYVSVAIDSKEDLFNVQEESQLFYESKKVINQLLAIAKDDTISINNTIIIEDEKPYRYRQNLAIAHIEKNLYRYPYKVYQDKCAGLFMCEASTIQKEINYVADTIMNLVMDKGYRYSDIAVVTGDLDTYERSIRLIFSKYNIPFFVDAKKSIQNHPLVEFLLSLLQVYNSNFSYESMFRFIKTGFLDLDNEIIDLLENYVLGYGIRGESMWKVEWNRRYPLTTFDITEHYIKDIMNQINLGRESVINPLLEFKRVINSRPLTVSKITKGLYDFIESLHIEEKIQEQEKSFGEKGLLGLQREYGSIFKLVISIFDQMISILGDEEITFKDYSLILKAGLEDRKMGLVPPSLDGVVVGDLERTRIREVKGLFVVGLNEGKVPKVFDKPNLITDKERNILNDIDITLAPDARRNVFKEQFNIYMGLLRVRERLYLSYAKSDESFNALRVSLLFNNIKKLFLHKHLEIIDIDKLYDERLVINRPLPTFSNLVHRLNHKLYEDNNTEKVYQWFYHQETWKDKILHLEEGIHSINEEVSLQGKASSELYGKTLSGSVSRLEIYSKCPFAHFIDYGLRLEERPEYMIKMPDIGILFHKAIDKFSKMLANRNINFEDVTKEMIDEFVNIIIDEIIEKEERGIFLSTSRNKYLVKRLTRITKRAIWAIKYQISKGEFRPTQYEYNFDGERDGLKTLTIDFDNKRSMKLRGQIDRLDTYENEENMYITIVDYKSGNKKFDIAALYYGLQLQLLVYLNASEEVNGRTTTKQIVPAGVFYFYIDDPIIKDIKDRDTIDKNIIEKLKLEGIVLNDLEIIKKLDQSFMTSSDIIPVALKKNNELTKSSSTVSEERFRLLQNYANKKVKAIGKEIVNGDISISPYEYKGKKGCDYCPYLSICQFENGIRGNSYRKLKDLKSEEVFELIQED